MKVYFLNFSGIASEVLYVATPLYTHREQAYQAAFIFE